MKVFALCISVMAIASDIDISMKNIQVTLFSKVILGNVGRYK